MSRVQPHRITYESLPFHYNLSPIAERDPPQCVPGSTPSYWQSTARTLPLYSLTVTQRVDVTLQVVAVTPETVPVAHKSEKWS